MPRRYHRHASGLLLPGDALGLYDPHHLDWLIHEGGLCSLFDEEMMMAGGVAATLVQFQLVGARGGNTANNPAYVTCSALIAPGTVLTVGVGQGGQNGNINCYGGGGRAGIYGGAYAGGAGGGRSWIEWSGAEQITAGGSGGGFNYWGTIKYGGAGGTPDGAEGGLQNGTGDPSFNGGYGGTQTAGGGYGYGNAQNGTSGSARQGGYGGDGGEQHQNGGGGGGGYYGGGGGGGGHIVYSAGGGGSSRVSSLCTNAAYSGGGDPVNNYGSLGSPYGQVRIIKNGVTSTFNYSGGTQSYTV
jgi:hypothetical protein